MDEKILVLDFGGQYNQLIARRVREQQVYAEIKPFNKITPAEIRQIGYKGIIFTGGPNSVYDPASPHFDPQVLNLGIPVLGICYGDQLMAYMAGGTVSSAESSSEYGKTTLYSTDCALFRDVPHTSFCWMSHTDFISQVPQGFCTIAHTDKCHCAAMCDESRRLYGVQFHPEVSHTAYGFQMLHNFLFDICGCHRSWNMEDFVQRNVAKYQKQLSGKKNCEYEDGEKPFFFFACRSHEPEKDAAEGGDEKHSGSDHRNLLCPGKQGIEKTGSVPFGEGEACDICSCCSENQEKQLCRKPR